MYKIYKYIFYTFESSAAATMVFVNKSVLD